MPVAVMVIVVIVVLVVSVAISMIIRMTAPVISAIAKSQTGTTHNKNKHNGRNIFFHSYLLLTFQ